MSGWERQGYLYRPKEKKANLRARRSAPMSVHLTGLDDLSGDKWADVVWPRSIRGQLGMRRAIERERDGEFVYFAYQTGKVLNKVGLPLDERGQVIDLEVLC